MSEVTKWTVIFLLDSKSPAKIGLLRRSEKKSFAPNFYTGIGGKIGDIQGFENETPLEGAYRELAEETENELTGDNTTLSEFARCIHCATDLVVYYFWSLCKELPTTDLSDGELVWVSTEKVLEHDLIPTTKAVCTEWQKRHFHIDHPFTVYVSELGMERTVQLVKTIRIKEGLSL